ncbi:hypothetical protein VPH35_026404 [Triticum aestivum]
MVEKHVVVICAAVSALALAAAVLGIIGEATKSRSFVRYNGVNCVYRRTPAFDCGIAAAASLLISQAILTVATGCWDGCRQRRSSSDHRRVGDYIASILSWFLTILSTCTFLAGALRNDSAERRPKEGVASYYQSTSAPSSWPGCSPAPRSSRSPRPPSGSPPTWPLKERRALWCHRRRSSG